MTSYPSNHPMASHQMYHPNIIPSGIPGPMGQMPSSTPMHPISALHTPVGTIGSMSSTPMEVVPADSMQQISEDIAMSQPVVESMEELRVKYKQELIRLEEILANRFSVDDCSSLIAAGLGATIIYPTPHTSLEDFEKKLIEFFQTQVNTKAQSGQVLLQDYLNFITKQRGQQRVNYLFSLLITMITKHGILNFSMVYISVLELYSLQLPLFIQEGLKFVHKLLPTLDYHACRVVITQLLIFLEKCPTKIASPLSAADSSNRNGNKECPPSNYLTPRDLQLLHSVRDLLKYMLDRKSALLPVYLALDDIELRYPFKSGSYTGPQPHWIISDLLSSFRDSFSGVARLITMPISHRLLPAVGISFMYGVVWQFDDELTLCPKVPKDTGRKVNQILPFSAEVNKKRFDLLLHIASQSICPEPVLPQLYGMPRMPLRQATTPEQQALYNQVNMILCTQIAVNLLRNCRDGLLNIPERRLWSYQQANGLCMSYLLKFISHRHFPMNTFYYLLYKLLVKEELRDGRDALMYFFVQSMSLIFRPTEDPLQPVDMMLAIFDHLYPDSDPLPIPDISDPLYVYKFSPSFFWMHLYLKMLDFSEKKKTLGSSGAPYKFSRPMPRVLKLQIDHLHTLSTQHNPATLSCQELIVMSNALPPHIQTQSLLDPGLKLAQDQLRECLNGLANQRPPSIPLLSCLNLNCKVDTIVKDMVSLVHDPQHSDRRPLEVNGRGLIIHTFFSLFHNADLDLAGYRVMTKSPVDVIKKHVYNINTCWLEMVNNRLPIHVTNALKHQLLVMITQYLKSCPTEIQNYLYLLLENTALKLIIGLDGQYFIHYMGSKQPSHPIDSEFEELNKVFILKLAQTIHTRGIDPGLWDDYLECDVKSCPHFWPSHTLRCFPSQLQDFYERTQIQKPIGTEEMQLLQMHVSEDSHRLFSSMNVTDVNIVSYYSLSESHPTLLCLTWDVIMEKSKLSHSFIKAFITLGQRGLMRHMRGFIDYIVLKLCQEKDKINRYIEVLDYLIWTYNLFPLEKIILVMAMKNYEGEQLHTCYRLMQLLLLVPSNFRFRLKEFLNSDNSPSYWSQPEQLNDHLEYHADKPEYFNFEGLRAGTSGEEMPKPLPPFCGNVLTRFLPVIDIVVHRLIEVPPDAAKSLDNLILQISPLYKYHPKPIMFLYTTLHYYEANLVNRPLLRANLVYTILNSLNSIHTATWYFTREFVDYLVSKEGAADGISMNPRDEPEISLPADYWSRLLQSIKEAVYDPLKCDCWTDWRFSEFQSPAAKFLTCISVEILTLHNSPAEISKNILRVVLDTSKQSIQVYDTEEEVSKLINAVGLLMSMLPTSYHEVLYAEVLHALENIEDIVAIQGLAAGNHSDISVPVPAISLSAFSVIVGQNGYIGRVLALMHSFWTHSNVGLLYPIQNWLLTVVKPIVQTENQLIFMLQLIYPLSPRLYIEKRRHFLSLVQIIYSFVKQVDSRNDNLFYADTICDVLYHIKYVYLGNANKDEIGKIVSSLQPPLQARLRFLTGGEPHTVI
ncbi:Mediator of RNA polymerase II transcription subunit 23-like [Oopsacas minuta]|uniref:Mediator of RNA polymerase II transcription subunit 23 n=1 Tax=Oopsacas minuta TaxID=111878 RepID=A0AAV7K1N0_9METZ|nr:Mediator of RNA polymerase II transcription subunit 23-like [Oopsacas minuta]